ncbi:MAG TPA: Gfo/Idh/MocA family oxidoreductase [Tepidisphaeraceae bacterium]|nr:Gfo/Idh/MocA family oxidoreductase [Tepidisphaeraceae bacterium]
MTTTNIAIVGLGMMGRTHYEAYQEIEGARVVAVADRNARRAAGDLSNTSGNVLKPGLDRLPMDRIRGTTDARDVLAMDDVDVVDVCVPTTQHVEIVTAALRAGKHVLCEKPLARTSAEGETIAAAARSASGIFMPAMCMRFWPQWAWLKRAVVDCRYGAVRSATFRRVAQMPAGWYADGAKSGGGALDLHVHDTDFVQHLFGMPRGVSSRGYSMTSGEIDHISTQFIYDDVPLVIAEGGWCLADGYGFTMQYTVNFERATADFELSRDQPLRLSEQGRTTAIDCGPGFGYVHELRYFLDCVRSGEPPTVVTADDAVRTLRLVEAEVSSARSGHTVHL